MVYYGDMKSHTPWIIAILILLGVVGYLSWRIFATPLASPTPEAVVQQQEATSTAVATSSAPLSASVHIDTPASNAVVGTTFIVTGAAPSGWYFEAVFPISVRDNADNVIGHGQAQALSDWTQPGQIRFAATTTIDTVYHGPATLILLKDNPSGLPENDDSVSMPIVVQ